MKLGLLPPGKWDNAADSLMEMAAVCFINATMVLPDGAFFNSRQIRPPKNSAANQTPERPHTLNRCFQGYFH